MWRETRARRKDRESSALPVEGTTGDIEALSLWAGQSVALAKRTQPAADIIAELTSRPEAGTPERGQSGGR